MKPGEPVSVSSSWIVSVSFDPETQEITVNTIKGGSYNYPASQRQFEELLAAPSVGRYVMANWK